MRRRLEAEFQDVADIFLNPKGKLIFLSRVCTQEKLAIDFIDKLSSVLDGKVHQRPRQFLSFFRMTAEEHAVQVIVHVYSTV